MLIRTKLLTAAAFLGISLYSTTLAFADEPYDLSDIQQSFVEWPFPVASFNVTGESYQMRHEIRFDVDYKKVLAEFMSSAKKNKKYGKFIISSVTESANRTSFDAILTYHSDNFYVTVKPDGAGTLVDLQCMPFHIKSAALDPAVFGYRMPDGGVLPIGKYREDGL